MAVTEGMTEVSSDEAADGGASPSRSHRGEPPTSLTAPPRGTSHDENAPPVGSILFVDPESDRGPQEGDEPAYASDLHIDQIVQAITAGRAEYGLEPFFYQHLGDADTIHFRHEVFRDLESKAIFGLLTTFSEGMGQVRKFLSWAAALPNRHQKNGWFLEATRTYCEAVTRLGDGLASAEVTSRGLRGIQEYVSGYLVSEGFLSVATEAERLNDELSGVRYCIQIKGLKVTVRKYDSEPDYSIEVLDTFERFKQGAVDDYRIGFSNPPSMNPVEGRILDRVARLFTEIFNGLDAFRVQHGEFLDRVIRDFDREVQFYIAYLEHIEPFRSAGLTFCYPNVQRASKAVAARDTFDLSLASVLVPKRVPVVCNDFHLSGAERTIVVSGPNQGGKTTFARTFGQLHHLGNIGCPVPGRQAQLFLYDRLFTHFGREEESTYVAGKLEEDLLRIRDVLNEATPESVIIMNEIFSSTTLDDARLLGRRVMERIFQLDLLCVYVTFVDELASLNESVVSMASTVVPDDPAVRTFKVVRKPADGLAYAIALAEKYGLTFEQLRKRIDP